MSLEFKGARGSDVIRAVMDSFRNEPPSVIAGKDVIAIVDYLQKGNKNRVALDPSGHVLFDDSEPADTDFKGYCEIMGVDVPMFWHADYRVTGQKARLPLADTLMFVLDGGSKVILRPSGTEPKIKFYFGVKAPLEKVDDFDQVHQELNTRIESIIDSMGLR